MFNPNKPTAGQLPALKELILKMVQFPDQVPQLESILDTRDIMKLPEDMTLQSPHELVPKAWLPYECDDKVRPAMLVWAWFYPSYFEIVADFSRALTRVNSWGDLNPWNFQLAARHPLPLMVMAKSRTVVNNLRAEKDAEYQRRKLARKRSQTQSPAIDSGDFDFID